MRTEIRTNTARVRQLAQETGALNDSDRLRTLIDDCEKALASLNAESARLLMENVTAAHRLLDSLQATGADLRGEEARLGTVDDRIVRYADDIVRALGGRPALVALREQVAPRTTERWWLLDAELDRRRQQRLKQLGILAVVVAVILVAGYIARPVLFPPDPVGDAVTAASRALDTKNPTAAIAAIDSGLAQLPTNTELLIWKGALFERAGDQKSADAAYQQGLSYADSEREFYFQRALAYVRMGEYARVVTDTTTLINQYPDMSEAYYIRATGYEGLNKRSQAYSDLEKCSELAQAVGNDTLYAQARVRMGTLLQGGLGQGQ
jgi:tetratricopeptide (TPR) repeat protein